MQQAHLARPGNYDLDDLRAFSLIVTAGGISAAARQSDFTKSTLSRAVRRLEAAAGTPLFDRVGKGLRPTPIGETLVEIAHTTLRVAQEADETLRGAQGAPQGPLRVAANASNCQWLLAPMAAKMAHEYPDVQIEMIVESQRLDPLSEGLDLALRAGLPDQSYLVARRVLTGKFMLYAHKSRITDIDIDDPESVEGIGRIVVNAPGVPRSWQLRSEDGRTLEMKSEPLIVAGETRVAVDVLRSGAGIGYLLDTYVEGYFAHAGLVPVLPAFQGVEVSIYATLAPGRSTVPGVRVFLDMLIEHAQAIEAEKPRDT